MAVGDKLVTLDGLKAVYQDLNGNIDDVKSAVDDITTVIESDNKCNPSTVVLGRLTSSGTVNEEYTDYHTTDFIPVPDTDGLYITAFSVTSNGGTVNAATIAFYNSAKTFMSRKNTPAIPYAVAEGAAYIRVSMSNGNAYMVGFSTDSTTALNYADYGHTIKIAEDAVPASLYKISEWTRRFAECEFDGSNVHLSIDDVGYAFYALKTEAPESLWDNTFFGQLKTLHDTYGVCITCNCFSFLNSEENYDLATVPNTWADEFAAAKGWLKFAFHAKNNTINYNSAVTLATDYTYFVNAIYAITGDYDCIDRCPRLTSFSGTKSQIVQAIAVPYGPVMLLTADDTRNSYYLDSDESAIVSRRGKRIDDETGMVFIASMPRLDSKTIDTDIAPIIESQVQRGKLVELYCHENLSGEIASSTVGRINNALTWFNSHGYTSHFLMDIYE